MKLRDVNRPAGHNRYCGPAVVSAVTGCDTNHAATLMRRYWGRRAIRGSYTEEVRHALSYYGIRMVRRDRYPKGERPTLAAWLKANKGDRTAGRVFLVSAGRHWQLVSGRRYVCGRIGKVVSIRDKRIKRRARVAAVWELHQDTLA